MIRIMFIVIAILLAGCSSGGNTVFERMAPMVQQQVLGSLGFDEASGNGGSSGKDGAPEPRAMSRADLEKIPYAVISIKRSEERRVGKEDRTRWKQYDKQ